ITTDALQELHFAATQGGASIEDFDKSLLYFVKQLGQASAGAGDLYKVLQANGIALRDANGNIRPVVDILKDYADLLGRAGSEQERAALSAMAFGRAGADMANVFRNGSSDIGAAADELHRLNGVIDAATLQRIADIDDRFDALATTLGTNFKSNVLVITDAIYGLVDSFKALDQQLDSTLQARLVQVYAELDAAKNNPQRGTAAGQRAGLEQRIQSLTDEALKIRDVLDRRAGYNPNAATTQSDPAPKPLPAIVPGGGDSSANGGRDTDAERVQRQREQVDQYIASLEEERRLVGAADEERAVSNNLRLAGADATDAQRQKIEDLTRSLVQEQEQWAGLQEASQFFGDQLYSAIDGLLIQGDSLNDVFANLAKTIAEAALQAALLGQGPLAGLLGGGSGGGGAGGIIGAILSAVAGGGLAVGGTGGLYANGAAFAGGNVVPFANGGVVTRPTLFPMARGMGLMGEAGPEAVMPLRRGRDGRLGVAASAAPINVTINNSQAGEIEVQTRSERAPDGEKLVIDVVKRAIARGDL
ncbi:MAG: hypothetical protein J0H54_00175, partial [Rhizobiales bacterium]|nr:hypothetical protein [Hyphomicrobiales bacterium]